MTCERLHGPCLRSNQFSSLTSQDRKSNKSKKRSSNTRKAEHRTGHRAFSHPEHLLPPLTPKSHSPETQVTEDTCSHMNSTQPQSWARKEGCIGTIYLERSEPSPRWLTLQALNVPSHLVNWAKCHCPVAPETKPRIQLCVGLLSFTSAWQAEYSSQRKTWLRPLHTTQLARTRASS